MMRSVQPIDAHVFRLVYHIVVGTIFVVNQATNHGGLALFLGISMA